MPDPKERIVDYTAAPNLASRWTEARPTEEQISDEYIGIGGPMNVSTADDHMYRRLAAAQTSTEVDDALLWGEPEAPTK
jgi:hypothetical protein